MAKLKSVTVGFLGGVGEIGKNMTVLGFGNKYMIVDAGQSFPTEDTPGIDNVIPDMTFVRENCGNIVGLFLTHGHEDHIGAVPYLLQEFDLHVYGSDLTIALLQSKLEERKIKSNKLHVVKAGDVTVANPFKVEYIHVCHSIAGAFALSVTTPAGVVFFTGDYKFDYTPPEGGLTDIPRLSRIGDRGVLLMLGESTNVEREGSTVSERMVGENFDMLFDDNASRRIIVATFASNVNRLQQIINTAVKYRRKVAFGGRSMVKIAEIGRQLGLLHVEPESLVDIDKIKKVPDEELVIVSTGSQGEQMSALTRMAAGEYNKIHLGANDTVIISASPIPGNERSVYSVINNLCRLGCKVVYHTLKDIHVSGHAHREELKLMLSLVRPKMFIPVHGEYRHLTMHADLAETMGVARRNILIPEIGALVRVNARGVKRIGSIPAGNTYIDGDESGEDSMEMIIRDRRQLASDGLVLVFVSVRLSDGKLASAPEVLLRGVAAADDFVNDVKSDIQQVMAKERYTDPDKRGALKSKLGRAVRNRARQYMHSLPMVVPVIVEV